jgi:outer membrane lipopolysaccharide assembly protein LptE/RlpB
MLRTLNGLAKLLGQKTFSLSGGSAVPAAMSSERSRKVLRATESGFRMTSIKEFCDPEGKLPKMITKISLSRIFSSSAISICLFLSGCGYHTANHAQIRLPAGINTIAVPIFGNKTNSYKAEQVLTQAVVREFTSRSPYKVIPADNSAADAVLQGTLLTTNVYPLTFDSQTGRQSSAIVQLNLSVKLVDKHGNTLFENPNYMFREQYQVSREVTSFFDESPPAVDRLSRDFARTLVADILEGF